MSMKDTVEKRLADAYLRLLETNDPGELSVSDIAGEADVSRTTFYRHFSSKDDVFEYVVAEHAEFLRSGLKAVLDAGMFMDAEELTVCSSLPELAALVSGCGVRFERLRPLFKSPMSYRFSAELHARLRAMQARATAAARNDFGDNPVYLYYIAMLTNAILGGIEAWYSEGMREDPEELARIMTYCIKRRPLGLL
jgi:AcrR family transcriptional regulator